MQIDIYDEKKQVCVWLTKEESANTDINRILKPLYEEYKRKKYMVAVYYPGNEDIMELLSELLRYNVRLFAERELQAEKQAEEQAGKQTEEHAEGQDEVQKEEQDIEIRM